MFKQSIFSLVLILFAYNLVFSQTRTANGQKVDRKMQIHMPGQILKTMEDLDTLVHPALADTCGIIPFTFSPNEQWGFVGGTNGFLDWEKAQQLTYSEASAFYVHEVWGWFESPSIGSDGNMVASVYETDPDTGGPVRYIGSSAPLKVSELNTDPSQLLPTVFTFDPPVLVTGNSVLASIDFSGLYATQDTVTLFMTEDGCGDGANSWELFGDGATWTPISESWQLNSDFFISAVVSASDVGQTLVEPAIFADTCSQRLFDFLAGEEWGSIGGNNGFQDKEKAQKLTYENNGAPFQVKQVWGWFAYGAAVDDGDVLAKAYLLNPDTGGPGDIVGLSDPVKVSQLRIPDANSPVSPTIFNFSDGLDITDPDFFVAIDVSQLYTSKDTVALFMTDEECGNGLDSWELFSDDTWVAIGSGDSWQLNSNFLLAGIIEFDITLDVEDAFVIQRGLKLFPAFPNPAREQIQFKFQLDQPQKVMLEVYSMQGQLLQRQSLGNRFSGEHTESLDVSSFPAGTYVYGLVTESSRLMSQFVISR